MALLDVCTNLLQVAHLKRSITVLLTSLLEDDCDPVSKELANEIVWTHLVYDFSRLRVAAVRRS